MTIIDERGRLFGRINLVDGAAVVVALFLIPLAYGTFLLFRPASPRIDSVTQAPISKEEQRLSAGGRLTAKFKVRGTGFTPLLRARVGSADALALVFENPNSADLLVGPVPEGAHDLILIDGVQEVARAAHAIVIQAAAASFVRSVGWLTSLDDATANSLRVGLAFPELTPAYEILALGPPVRGRVRVSLAGSYTDTPVEGLMERAAVLTLRCDPAKPDNPCTMGDAAAFNRSPVTLILPGPTTHLTFALEELLPATTARRASVRVELAQGTPRSLIRVGDRDDLLDERVAMVTAIGPIVTIDMGLDDSRGGWRYRSQPIRPGAAFVMSTERYEMSGTIESVVLAPANGTGKR